MDCFFDGGRVGSGVDEVKAVRGARVFVGRRGDERYERVVRMARVPEGGLESGYQQQKFLAGDGQVAVAGRGYPEIPGGT
jgi:hypothetical protein